MAWLFYLEFYSIQQYLLDLTGTKLKSKELIPVFILKLNQFSLYTLDTGPFYQIDQYHNQFV